MKLVELNWPDGKAELGGVKRDVRLDLLEDVKVGDYVIVHAGYARNWMRKRPSKP